MSAASPTQNREPTELISDDGARGSDSNVGNTSFNVARLLTEMAHAMPNAVAIAEAKHPKCRRRYGEQNLAISHAGYHTASFAWLDADSSAIAAGLREMGIKPGMRIALLVPPGIDFVSLVFALLKLGAVQVLIDPGMGKQNVLRSLAEVRPEGIISVAFVQALRWLLRRKLPDATRNVTVHGYGLFHSQQMFGETLEQLRQRGARQVAGAGLKGSPGEATLGDASLVVARSPDRVTASTEGLRTGVHGRPAVGDCARSGDLRTTEDFQVFAATADAPAAIIFTSGSTGPAKGVLYRHGNFDTQVREIRNFYGIEPGGIDVACFPLFGLFNAAMGVTTVFPNMDFTRPAKVDPRNIVAAITDWQATQSFASPAVWNLVGKHCEVNHIQLPSLRRVFSCGAPVAAHVLRRMKSCIASDGEMFTPYGATEALPVASISASEVVGNDFNHGVAGVDQREPPVAQLGAWLTSTPATRIEFTIGTQQRTEQGLGVCVGSPMGCVEWRVVKIVDGPIRSIAEAIELPRGEIGELVVKGAAVTTEYVTRTDANATAKIPDDGNRGWLGSRYSEPPGAPLGAPDGRPQPPDEYTSDDVNRKAFWHRMGDVGYLDDQNRFWFCGRMSQRVVIPWRTGDRATLFTIPCEAIFNRHHDVYRSALIGVGSKEQVVPAIVVEPLLGRMPRGNTARMKLYGELLELAESSPLTAGIESIMICKSLPVDVRHNVKINRELLAIWATKKRLSRLP